MSIEGFGPVTDVTAAAARVRPPPDSLVSVLQVDDDAMTTLPGSMFHVTHVTSPAEVSDWLRGRHPAPDARFAGSVAAVVLDLDLGVRATATDASSRAQLGLDALRRLRDDASTVALPVVLYTGELEDRRDLLAVLSAELAGGPLDWFPKRIRRTEPLASRIRVLAEHAAAGATERRPAPAVVPFRTVRPVTVRDKGREVPLTTALLGSEWHRAFWTELRNGEGVVAAARRATDAHDPPPGTLAGLAAVGSRSLPAKTCAAIWRLYRDQQTLSTAGGRPLDVSDPDSGSAQAVLWAVGKFGEVLTHRAAYFAAEE